MGVAWGNRTYKYCESIMFFFAQRKHQKLCKLLTMLLANNSPSLALASIIVGAGADPGSEWGHLKQTHVITPNSIRTCS